VSPILRNPKAAREEFSAAVRWYEEQRPGLGGEFFDAVVHAAFLIQAQPELGKLSGIDEHGRYCSSDFPIRLFTVFHQMKL
jgi:hypothetical protein